MTKQNRKDAYEKMTERIIAALDAGTVPWHRPWTDETAPRNLATKRAYSGSNVFVLWATQLAENYKSPYWLTYNQARKLVCRCDKAGKCGCPGGVRKGEHGTPVLFWKLYERKVTSDDGTTEKKRAMFARSTTAFHLDQCDGIEAPKIETGNTDDPIEACEAVVSGYNNGPSIRHAGGRACYDPRADRVTVPEFETFDGVAEYYSTMFHELGHSTGHESRLNRPGVAEINPFDTHKYADEELVAEMTAAFLCGTTGIENETVDNSAAYIDSWRKRLSDDPKLIVHAAARAQKAANYIIEGMEADCVAA